MSTAAEMAVDPRPPLRPRAVVQDQRRDAVLHQRFEQVQRADDRRSCSRHAHEPSPGAQNVDGDRLGVERLRGAVNARDDRSTARRERPVVAEVPGTRRHRRAQTA